MAKTLVKLENNVRVKYLVKAKKYVLFYGNRQLKINGKYQKGVETQEEAVALGNRLTIKLFMGEAWANEA